MARLAPKFVPPGIGPVLNGPGGDISIPKIMATETADRLSVTEHTVMPLSGPPLHVHSREDEAFWVLDGEVAFWVDGKKIVASAGSFVFGPRGVPHTFRNLRSQPSRMLLVVTPPSNFEEFYSKIGGPREDGTAPSEAEVIERIVRHAPGHGIEILGPSPL
ncbi:Quercetin 2,3-dioxygenase [Phycisphaerales bacterium]|nr:Quercetin 2,3-dioxygenase [Phycisphaerales bacterium]